MEEDEEVLDDGNVVAHDLFVVIEVSRRVPNVTDLAAEIAKESDHRMMMPNRAPILKIR